MIVTNIELAGTWFYRVQLYGTAFQLKLSIQFLPMSRQMVLVCISRTKILSGIQFTRHFIDFVVVETKRFVSSKVYVLWTLQAGLVQNPP
jgi:hypothetical protein